MSLPASLVTANYARTMYEASGKRYRHAAEQLAQYALLATALVIREHYPTATHLLAGVSDQGPYLTPDVIIDPECEFDDNEVEEPLCQDELWGFVCDLDDEDPLGLWTPFVTVNPDRDVHRHRAPVDPTGRVHSYALDLDLIIFCEGDARVALVDQQNEAGVVTCDRHDGSWGDDPTCPRCTKIVGALIDERDIVAEVPGGYVVARNADDPGPLTD